MAASVRCWKRVRLGQLITHQLSKPCPLHLLPRWPLILTQLLCTSWHLTSLHGDLYILAFQLFLKQFFWLQIISTVAKVLLLPNSTPMNCCWQKTAVHTQETHSVGKGKDGDLRTAVNEILTAIQERDMIPKQWLLVGAVIDRLCFIGIMSVQISSISNNPYEKA